MQKKTFVLPHKIGNPKHGRETNVGWMTNMSQETIQITSFIQRWFTELLDIIINLLDTQYFR